MIFSHLSFECSPQNQYKGVKIYSPELHIFLGQSVSDLWPIEQFSTLKQHKNVNIANIVYYGKTRLAFP